jgi:U4/U6.U5 tri-snRNP-associated protein 3
MDRFTPYNNQRDRPPERDQYVDKYGRTLNSSYRKKNSYEDPRREEYSDRHSHSQYFGNGSGSRTHRYNYRDNERSNEDRQRDERVTKTSPAEEKQESQFPAPQPVEKSTDESPRRSVQTKSNLKEDSREMVVEEEAEVEEQNEQEDEMMKMMGFSGFDSSKGKPRTDKNVYAANIIKKRQFRQFMHVRPRGRRKPQEED